jgi:hypothetical protein
MNCVADLLGDPFSVDQRSEKNSGLSWYYRVRAVADRPAGSLAMTGDQQDKYGKEKCTADGYYFH